MNGIEALKLYHYIKGCFFCNITTLLCNRAKEISCKVLIQNSSDSYKLFLIFLSVKSIKFAN